MGIFVFKERKNFMKRTVSVFLVVLLACSIFVSASGTNGAGVAEPLPEMRTVTTNGYTLTILEQVMENGQIVRTYHNPKANLCQEEATSTMSTENKQAKAEAILTALGMDEQYISDIPEDTLIESADCEQIVTTISHTKRDADGNVTYLTDAEMAEVAATLAQKPEDTYENLYMIYETECTETIADMRNVHVGDWYGSAGLFDLPDDVSVIGGGITYTDLRAYYEYEAHLRHPTLATNFNSVGTYAHMQGELAWDLSLSIDTGGIAASVGIAVIPEERQRSAQISIHYVPD